MILESGDFIPLKPEGMKRVGLSVGDTVTAVVTPLGQQWIDARSVNEVEL